MKIPTAVIAGLLLTSCASTELTQEGSQVRRIGEDSTGGCDFLGSVTDSENMGFSIHEDRLSAMNKVRNQVGGMGGNAFVLVSVSTTLAKTLVQADAYNC